MSNVDDVRRAARVLREAAQRATPGLWGVGNGTHLASDVEQMSRGAFSARYSIAEMEEDDRESWLAADADNPANPEDDATYIALVQPQVGLTIADWLDLVASLSDAAGTGLIPAVMDIVQAILRADDSLAAAEAVA